MPRRLTGETVRHAGRLFAALAVSCLALYAQSPAIANVSLPTSGASVFDAAGNLYSIGSGPVTPGAAQTQNGGGLCSFNFFASAAPCPDAYAGKVDRTGRLVWGTYLGGPTADASTAIAVDSSGNVYLTGTTGGQFPTTANAAIASSATATAFAAEISADGSRVVYSTYLPATAKTPTAIAVNGQEAYIAGNSSSGHAFVLKLSADGSTVAFNIPLQGSNADSVSAIAVDSTGSVVVAGATSSPHMATSGVVQSQLAGAQNVFLAGLNSGGAIEFFTYLGGSGTDSAAAVALDSSGNIYVAGATNSPDFPATAGTFEPSPLVPMWNNSPSSGFVARLNAGASKLAWSTYAMSLNSPLQSGTTQLAVTPAGDVYAAGLTGAGFPVTPSAPQICFQGQDSNAYVIHLGAGGALLDASYAGVEAQSVLGLGVSGGSPALVWHGSATTLATLTFGAAGATAAPCLSPAILNSATFAVSQRGLGGIAAGEFVSLTGFEIGPDAGVPYQPDAQGQIPTALNGVQVLFDGTPAPVLYVQSRQVNLLAPFAIASATKTTISLVYNQNTVGTVTANVEPFGIPGIFRAAPGLSTAAAALNRDGSINSASNPAPIGSTIAVYGTGFGRLATPCTTGGLNPPTAVNLALGVVALIWDGQSQYHSPSYAGSAPTLACGVEQLNLQIPSYAVPPTYQFFPWAAVDPGDGSLDVSTASIGVTVYIR